MRERPARILFQALFQVVVGSGWSGLLPPVWGLATKKICLTLKGAQGAVDRPTWCPRRPEHGQNSAEANRQSPTADTPCFMSHPWMYSKNWMRCHCSAGTKSFPVANRGIARIKMAQGPKKFSYRVQCKNKLLCIFQCCCFSVYWAMLVF